MVAVASGFDAPIKLVMPHLTTLSPTKSCSMLGLGDIVIPGVFIIFLTKFGKQVNCNHYFTFSILAYVTSLVLCGIALFVFNAA